MPKKLPELNVNMWPFDIHRNQIQNCHATFVVIKILETKCSTTKILLHSFLSREHMNPQLTCSQHQWLHSSVGGTSHQYLEVTGSNPVEVLIFFSGFFTQLQKLRSLRQSFLRFQKYYKSKLRSNKKTRHVYIVYRLALHF